MQALLGPGSLGILGHFGLGSRRLGRFITKDMAWTITLSVDPGIALVLLSVLIALLAARVALGVACLYVPAGAAVRPPEAPRRNHARPKAQALGNHLLG